VTAVGWNVDGYVSIEESCSVNARRKTILNAN